MGHRRTPLTDRHKKPAFHSEPQGSYPFFPDINLLALLDALRATLCVCYNYRRVVSYQVGTGRWSLINTQKHRNDNDIIYLYRIIERDYLVYNPLPTYFGIKGTLCRYPYSDTIYECKVS